MDGDLYFSVRSDPRFGQVSGYDEATMLAVFGERGGDPDRPGKKDPLDCLLWQAERPGEPAWDSPLGRGRPGWHIECSAIALHHLGREFDVQGGGSDLVFPHHEMSASEAQAAFDGVDLRPGLRARREWSATRARRCRSPRATWCSSPRCATAGVDPMAIRLALLGHHYRSDWEWTDADLSGAQERLARWRAAVGSASYDGAAASGRRGARGAGATTSTRPPPWRPWTRGPRRGRRGDGSGADVVRRLLDARLGILL